MFRLRQKTRRQLCRAGFLIGCLLPTLALVLWGTFRHTSLYAKRLELSLEQSLGLRVHVSEVVHKRPGLLCYQDLQLYDAESGTPVATCDTVTVRMSNTGGPTDVSVGGLLLEHGGLTACFALLDRILRTGHSANECRLQIRFEQVIFADTIDADSLTDASVSIRMSNFESEALLSMVPAGQGSADGSSADKILLKIVRTRKSPAPITSEWELHTNKHAIPCTWLSAISGDLPQLQGSYFRGSCKAQDAESGGPVVVLGTFSGINIGGLANTYLDRSLDSTVDVELTEPARFRGGRLDYMQARVVGGPGRISRSLRDALSTSLGCSSHYNPQDSDGMVPYAHLDLEFRIDSRGQFAVAGRCNRSGAMLVDGDNRALLAAPRTELQPQSVLNLVRGLADDNGPPIPATPSSILLLERLPLPVSSAVSPVSGAARTPGRSPAAARPSDSERR